MKKTTGNDKKQRPQRIALGTIIDFSIAQLTSDGYGLAVHEHTQVLVSGALPGELVRSKITFSGRHQAHAVVIKVLRRSPARLLEPPCGRSSACDSCQLIHMNYRNQLAWKRNLVEETLRSFSAIGQVAVCDLLPSPKPLGYRTSAKLVLAGTFTEPVVGIYRRNSHDVVDLDNCPLHHPLINQIVTAVKTGIRKGKVPIYHPRTGGGLLRYLVIRVTDDGQQAMVTFVTSQRNYNEIHHLAKFIQNSVPQVAVVAQNVNSSAGNVIMGPKDYFLTQKHELTERMGDFHFGISPNSFFQVNPGSARLIYEKVRDLAQLSGKETVVDLYCGVGGIALHLAAGAKRVIGIESVEAATVNAGENARRNGIRNCEFIAGDARVLLKELAERDETPGVIVLNPPRKGCEELVLRQVTQLAPARIIYVSCSPQTLARDLAILVQEGYACTEVQPVDMFPQTPHVETVVLLTRSLPAH